MNIADLHQDLFEYYMSIDKIMFPHCNFINSNIKFVVDIKYYKTYLMTICYHTPKYNRLCIFKWLFFNNYHDLFNILDDAILYGNIPITRWLLQNNFSINISNINVFDKTYCGLKINDKMFHMLLKYIK